ncbi:MAG: phosphatase PAP2 family protein [Acidimicrobiales bacterium]
MLPWLVYLGGVVVVVVVVAGLTRPAGGLTLRAMSRVRAALSSLVEALGGPLAYLVALSAGVGATLVATMAVGLAARASRHYDKAMYRWWLHHHSHTLTAVMRVLTQLGDSKEMRIAAIVACVALVALRPRFAWVTIFAIVSVMALEFELQLILSLAIHRGHPPIGRGTYPSGGVARLVSLPGVVLLLCARFFEPFSRRLRTAGWVVVSLLGWTEFFSRLYLGKHYTSDAIGGAVFGALLVLTVGLAVSTVIPAPAERYKSASPHSGEVPVATELELAPLSRTETPSAPLGSRTR